MWEQNHSGTVFSATNDCEESIIQIAILFCTSKENSYLIGLYICSFVLRKTDIFAEGTGGTG